MRHSIVGRIMLSLGASWLLLMALSLTYVSLVDASDVGDLTTRAIDLSTQGKTKEALPLFQKAVQLEGHVNSGLWNNLGVAQMRLGMFEDAATSFNRALSIDYDNVDAKDNLAELAKMAPNLRSTIASGSTRRADKQQQAADDDNEDEDEEDEDEADEEEEDEDEEAVKEMARRRKQAEKKKQQQKRRAQQEEDEDEDDEDEDDEDEEEEEEERKPAKRRKLKKRKVAKRVKKAKETASEKAKKTTKTASKSTSSEAKPSTVQHSKRFFDPNRYSRKPKRKQPPLPHVRFDELYLEKNKKYANGEHPFVLTGAMSQWHIEKLWTRTDLESRFPHAITDFYPANMDQADTHPYLTPLPNALRELYTPSGSYPLNDHIPGTYIQWNINLTDWAALSNDMMHLPYIFHRDEEWLMDGCLSPDTRNEFAKRTHWKMMLIGTKGAGMFNHRDVLRTSSWQAQITGAKKWHICSPTQEPYLYSAGEVDCFYPNYEKTPLFEHANCFEDVVRAGDFVFYPMDFWHQTENLETPSISISSSILDQNNWREISKELEAECVSQKYKWHFSPELCRDLNKCFKFWEERFDKKDRGKCTFGDKEAELAAKDEL